MKFGSNGLVLFCTLSFAQFTSAHYIFATLLTDSSSSSAAVRLPKENGPVKDITSQGVTCNVDIIKPATETVPVNAGSQVGFKLGEGKTIFHAGPAAMYIGKAPGAAADWDGSGQSWSKIAEWGATFNPFKFTALGMDTFKATLPADIPDGEYLLRMEHWALHIPGSPELYVGCAQIKVSGGGNANFDTVSIPGYIAPNDPSLIMDIYYPVPTAYKVPGPAVVGKSNESPAPSKGAASPPAQAPAPAAAVPKPATPVPTPAAAVPTPEAPAASPSAHSANTPAPPAVTPIRNAPAAPPAPSSSAISPNQGAPVAVPTGAGAPAQGPPAPAQPPANNAPTPPSAPTGGYPFEHPGATHPGGQGGYHQGGNCKSKPTPKKRSISEHRRRMQQNQF